MSTIVLEMEYSWLEMNAIDRNWSSRKSASVGDVSSDDEWFCAERRPGAAFLVSCQQGYRSALYETWSVYLGLLAPMMHALSGGAAGLDREPWRGRMLMGDDATK